MITLLTSILNGNEFGEILGIVLSVLEVIIVILTLISFFIPPESKVGKILSRILIGLYKSKNYVKDLDENKKKEEDDNEDRTDSN